MNITAIGIDLAKEVFAIHCVDKQGHVVLRKQLKRTEMTKFFLITHNEQPPLQVVYIGNTGTSMRVTS
jgi:transposase